MNAPVVRLSAVSRRYRLGRTEVPALTEVSLDAAAVDFLVLAGRASLPPSSSWPTGYGASRSSPPTGPCAITG